MLRLHGQLLDRARSPGSTQRKLPKPNGNLGNLQDLVAISPPYSKGLKLFKTCIFHGSGGAKKYTSCTWKQVAVDFHQLGPYNISNLVAYKQWYFPLFSRCTQNMFLWHWNPPPKKNGRFDSQATLWRTSFCLAILCDLFGMLNWALHRLSDLQLGDKKHLGPGLLFLFAAGVHTAIPGWHPDFSMNVYATHYFFS